MGPTSSLPHRINDLSLRVTSPSGDQYWGNVGLTDDHESETGGSSNTLDTVENVFLSNPEAGTWTIEVIGDEIVEDTHVETPAVDADFSLVASGGVEASGCYPDCDGNTVLDVFDFLCFQDSFTLMDPYADCDGNSIFDVFDFLCFQDSFVTGCP
jgi:hypothetical protein